MNHRRMLFMVLLICCSSIPLLSQNIVKNVVDDITTPGLYLGIESGIKTYNAFEIPQDFIREEAYYYYGYYGNYSALSLTSYSYFVALNAEYRILNDHLWLSGGVSYSTMHTSISKSSGSTNNAEYFYVLLNQQSDESHYYRVSEVDFLNHYVSIPLDFSFAPIASKYFKLFGKLSTDLNFRVATNKRATFINENMSSYEPAVLELFANPKNFYATAGFGGGILIGQKDKPNIRFDMDLVSVVLTQEAFSLVDQNVGFGCNVSFLIPIK